MDHSFFALLLLDGTRLGSTQAILLLQLMNRLTCLRLAAAAEWEEFLAFKFIYDFARAHRPIHLASSRRINLRRMLSTFITRHSSLLRTATEIKPSSNCAQL